MQAPMAAMPSNALSQLGEVKKLPYLIIRSGKIEGLMTLCFYRCGPHGPPEELGQHSQ